MACRDNPDRLRALIGEEVVAELRRHTGWVRVINNKKFIEKMGLSAAKISKRTLKPFLLLIEDLPEKENEAVASMLRKAIDELISTGFAG